MSAPNRLENLKSAFSKLHPFKSEYEKSVLTKMVSEKLHSINFE